MTDQPTAPIQPENLLDVIAFRMTRPSTFVHRLPAETPTQWSARAVAAGLADGSLGYVPATRSTHLMTELLQAAIDRDKAQADRDRLSTANKTIISENATLRGQRDSYKREVAALNDLLATARAELASANQQIATTKTHFSRRCDTLTARAERAETILEAVRMAATLWNDKPGSEEHDCRTQILNILNDGTAPVPGSSRRAQEEDADRQVIEDRDRYHEVADKLAAAIAEMTGVEIGEHSSANDPWQNALDAAQPAQEPGRAYVAAVQQLIGLASLIQVPNDGDRYDLMVALRAVEAEQAKLAPAGESQASEPARRAMLRGLTAAPMLAQVAERARVEAEAGAPARMVAHYVAVEARHLASSHDGPAQDCQDCNRAVHADQPAAPKLAQGGIIRRDVGPVIAGERPVDLDDHAPRPGADDCGHRVGPVAGCTGSRCSW